MRRINPEWSMNMCAAKTFYVTVKGMNRVEESKGGSKQALVEVRRSFIIKIRHKWKMANRTKAKLYWKKLNY